MIYKGCRYIVCIECSKNKLFLESGKISKFDVILDKF